MRTILTVAACLTLGAGLACAQQATLHDRLLDKLVGQWLLQGTIAGKATTHDIGAEWVLEHQYVRIHEVSRDKNAQGVPAYEAMVFVGWDQPTGDYVCVWLDTYGDIAPQSLGRAKRNGDEIHFLFQDKNSVFHTRFIYHKEAGNWEWQMDSEEKGAMKPFARVKLTRP